MKTLSIIFAFVLLAIGAASSTASAEYRYDPYVYDPGPRARVTVYPRPVPYFQDYSYFYPAVRGFEDRNPVPRGNMRGCTVDLGYGRYESCDK